MKNFLLLISMFAVLTFGLPIRQALAVASGNIVAPTTVTNFQSFDFSWSSSGATSCSISPGGWTGTSGSRQVGPLAGTTTYSLTCNGVVVDTATVNVLAGSLTATPSYVTSSGSYVTLTWSSSANPDTCTVWKDKVGRQPQIAYGGRTGTTSAQITTETTFYLSCQSVEAVGYDLGYASVTVSIGSTPPPPPAPTATIQCQLTTGFYSDGPCTVASGSSTMIDWTINNNDGTCHVEPFGSTASYGNVTTGSLTSSTTYAVYCDSVMGSGIGTAGALDTVTVNVISADLKVSETASNYVDGPLTVSAYKTIYLKATCSTAGGSGRISPGNINFNGTSYTGTASFATNPKTWTLTCYPSANQSGTPTAIDYVTVQLSTADFTLACNTVSKIVTAGQSAIFDTTATSLNGFASQVTVSITAGLPSGAGHTPQTVTPTASGAVASVPVTTSSTTPLGTYNLTFSATGGGKTHTCSSQLQVTGAGPVLVGLDLQPPAATISVGYTQNYISIASYSNGTTGDVTNSASYSSSNPSIASTPGGPTFTGVAAGAITASASYTEGGITKGDTGSLDVTSKGAGSITASIACPSGQSSCTIPSGTAVDLTWSATSSVGIKDCNIDPDLIPSAAGKDAGTASTGNLTTTTTYTLTCSDENGVEATDQATVVILPPSESFGTADKDITSVNGTAVASTACNTGTDPVSSTFRNGDTITFKVNLCNTGSSTASSISISDTLTNLIKPTTGWAATFGGVSVTPTESGTEPNRILTFSNLPGTIDPGATKSLIFTAVISAPTPLSNTIYRFQNNARISTTKGNWTAATPLYLFYAGSKVPSKQEVAP
jgi:hypothetical protein